MRKYNNKMKMAIGIVVVLFVVIVIVFSLFIKKSIELDKIEYIVITKKIDIIIII